MITQPTALSSRTHALDETELPERDDLVQLGVWMFLATVLMLFAAFTSAYIVRRSGSDWTIIDLPHTLWVNTALLAASSLAVEGARRGRGRGQAGLTRGWLSAAIGLGLLFLIGQFTVWGELVARGVYLPTSPHSSFFYILTGIHGLHVFAGLLLLTYALIRISNMQLTHGATGRLMTASATFWHFLSVLWLYLLALVTTF